MARHAPLARTLLLAGALAACAQAAAARGLLAAPPAARPAFVFSNALLEKAAQTPPSGPVKLPEPTPGGRAGARVVPVSRARHPGGCALQGPEA
jgi:hypothetical protein